VLVCAGGALGGRTQRQLWIHLPRDISIEDKVANLGQVGIVWGDESLVSRASGIALGRISLPGQQVTIDRNVLLSRLASNGIDASQVRITGAEKVRVHQRGSVISGSEFVEFAKSFLGKNPAAVSIRRAEAIGRPEDLAVVGTRSDVKLVPRLLVTGSPQVARVRIAVMRDGREIGRRDVVLRLQYERRRVVSLKEIPSGAPITRENVKIEKGLSGYPEPPGWSAPYGLVARRRIPAGTVIQEHMIGPPEPPVLVKRNQNVIIRIDAGALVVTAMGRSMDQGGAGDYLRVRNADSQRIIVARVNEDGTVTPVL